MKSREQKPQTEPYIRLSGADSRFSTEIRELWQYRDLIFLFVKREFTVKYKQTVLGPLWIFLTPIITSLIYLFIFGNIARIGTDGIPGILFYLSGHSMWSFFSSSLNANATAFTVNAKLYSKVYFPRLAVPISNVLSAGARYFIELALFAAVWLYFFLHGEVTFTWLAIPLLPVILLWLGILALGCGIIISSLTTKYRDLMVLVTFGVQLWMYGTPVVYPISTLTNPVLRVMVLLNPASAPMELMRIALFSRGSIIPWSLASSLLITALLMLAGAKLFNRVQKNFIDTI